MPSKSRPIASALWRGKQNTCSARFDLFNHIHVAHAVNSQSDSSLPQKASTTSTYPNCNYPNSHPFSPSKFEGFPECLPANVNSFGY